MSSTRSVRLEGFHAVKHALRFGADVHDLVTTDPAKLAALVAELAPDLAEALGPDRVREVDAVTWDDLVGRALPSPLFATCERPGAGLAEALDRPGRVVLLEDPTHLGNLGAVVRVAAAADAACVLTTGRSDPWHPTAVRTAAGLHLALPVLWVSVSEALRAIAATGRPLVALDERGPSLLEHPLPARAVLALGTERHGLSDRLRTAADRAVGIPMRTGVASLNLATAAAVALYSPGQR
jgi:TrmH family RNA methyltransferase